MTLSPQGRVMIERFGGCHKPPTDPSTPLSVHESAFIHECERVINYRTTAPLTQSMFDALVSFTFNVGLSAFRKSTLLKKINSLDYKTASLEFLRWVRDENGHPTTALTKRRKAESRLFLADGLPDIKSPTS